MELKRWFLDAGPTTVGGVACRKLTARVTDTVDVTAKVFLVRRKGELVEFVTVCAPSDLDNFPEDEPLEDAADPLYRVHEVTFTTDQPSTIELIRSGIDRRLDLLIKALAQIDVIVETSARVFSTE